MHHVKCTFACKSQLAKGTNIQAATYTIFGVYRGLLYTLFLVYNGVVEREAPLPTNPISEEDKPMTLFHHYINNFIYPTDNIPDHRSRRFGCCPCLMAVRELASFQQKSRAQAATRTRQAQNQPLAKAIRSALSSYHAGLRKASRGGQFSNIHTLYIKEN